MLYNGFLKVCAMTPDLEVGNPKYNVGEMLNMLKDNNASLVVFPELSVTGYSCGDLFFQSMLLEESNNEINRFLKENNFNGLVMIGAPLMLEGSLYNCAFVIHKHEILGIVPKKYIPNSKEFYEKRWFKSSKNANQKEVYFNGKMIPFGDLIFEDYKHQISIGVEICEDMWAPVSKANILAYHGANVICNLSGSNETLGKSQIRRTTVLDSSRRNCLAYIYASSGVNESTSETVFSGHNIIASCGALIKENQVFSLNQEMLYADIDIEKINFKRRQNTNLHDNIEINSDVRHIAFELEESKDFNFIDKIDITPFVPKNNVENDFNDISLMQQYALIKRIKHTNAKKLVIGVSGGLDSTLALLVSVLAFKKMNKPLSDIIAVTMPGYATSDRTYNNAVDLISKLGVTFLEKSIVKECDIHFETIGQDKNIHDITYENTQARIRTLILMDLANKYNGLVLGTGDMSELALGWCTYNGDQMSMYGINGGVPKTLVRFMVHCYSKTDFKDVENILADIIDTPISPELSDKGQATEAVIGKYEINDYILYRYLECGDRIDRIAYLLSKGFDLSISDSNLMVNKFFNRFFAQQFKRQALPDGPKILDISLSPRSDYRMPSDIKR